MGHLARRGVSIHRYAAASVRFLAAPPDNGRLMTTDQRYLQYGEPLYDRYEQTSVVLIDPVRPRVRDLDDETERLVLNADGNQKFGVGPDSKTVDVAYIAPDRPATRAYTIPNSRLTAPDVTDLTDGLSPTELAKAYMLRDLAAETSHPAADGIDAGELYRMAGRAGIPGSVIETSKNLPFHEHE